MFTTITAGRSGSADYVIDHESVSRTHAEITRSQSGRLYLIDCGSTWGTYVWRDEQWQKLQQGYIKHSETLAFGKQKVPVATLDALCLERSKKRTPPSPNNHFDPVSVKPRRNAITGEVEK
ncbi:FHA domain-containing protein [Halioxenophilus sp. WMMB6]|uniref:FHA domain-containing protein n=1 Tax=Halioxenophilus sp. WMMB6 TaxID=3073815 RepID=UPI00295E9B6B|nr:FHA domain-containing protein [Halioxenophilus sp. WMMB6]